MHAHKDISFLEDAMRSMMASRLAANAKLKIVDNKSSADYNLHGDVTAIGNSLSINATINDTDGSTPEATFYASAATENDIIPAVDTLAANICQQYFTDQGMVAVVPQGQVTTPTTSSAPPSHANSGFQTAHPDRAFLQPKQFTQPDQPLVQPVSLPVQPKQIEQTGSGIITPKPIAVNTNQGFKKTRDFPISMQDMAVGDIDGDGIDDLIIASKNEIFAYQMSGTNLALFGQITLPSTQKILSLETADLDHDGHLEIYITTVNRRHRPSALAVRFENNRFIYLFQNERWFIKPIMTPGRGKILIGQRAGIEYPIAKGIYELTIQDGRLVELSKLAIPAMANVYNFAMADLDGDGMTEVIMLDDNDKLHVTNAGGKQLWVSDDYYGGSLRFIGGGSATRRKGGALKQPVDEENDNQRNKTYLHSRIIVTDVNNDNQPDIIINKNLSSASRLFKNFKAYPSGEIHALSWSGIGLTELWRTKKIDGYIASYDFIKKPNATEAKLYVGLIINSGWMDVMSAKNSTILIYPLETPTTK